MRRAAAIAALLLALPVGAVEFRSIAERPAVLYDAPSSRADRLFIATRGYPFEVLVKLEQWTKVRDVNGEVAWVENKALADRAAVVVNVPVADVHTEPNSQSPIVFEAYKQVLLDVVEPASGEWVKVRHRDGQVGYIRVAHVWGA